MGGYGSGERGTKKSVVEGCRSIDTAKLKKWKLLTPSVTSRAGSFEWRSGGEEKPSSSVGYLLTVGEKAGTLQLLYSIKSAGADLDYSVRLVTTQCHLGGVRWWFVCPLVVNDKACDRRVRKLYLRGRYFGCRHCHRLAYRSSQESDSRVYDMLRHGLDGMGGPGRMSIPQLGVALKALTIQQKRIDRWLAPPRGKARI